MSNVQWRRIVSKCNIFIERCREIEASSELLSEAERLSALLVEDELVAIPKIYLESPGFEFEELTTELSQIYKDILSSSKRLSRVIDNMDIKT